MTQSENRVARGTENLLNATVRPAAHYCFVTRCDGPKDGPWHVHAECIDQAWVDEVWEELLATEDGRAFAALVDGRTPGDLGPSSVVRACWSWYNDRFWKEGAKPPTLSTLEFLLSAEDPWRVEAGLWYDGRWVPEGTVGHAVGALQAVMLNEPPYREPPSDVQLTNFLELEPRRRDGRIGHASLRALHSLPAEEGEPHPAPQGGPPAGTGGGAPETSTASSGPSSSRGDGMHEFLGGVSKAIDSAVSWLSDRTRRAVASLQALFDSPWQGPGGLRPAFAGGLPSIQSYEAPSPGEKPAPMRYCGAPGDNAGGQVANPAVGGDVLVFNIGQGNCNAIYDAAGTIVAYFDMGHPTALNTSSWPGGFVPCVCDDPIVILSHTDQDHYELGRTTPATHALTWVVPTGAGQQYGGIFGGLVANIRAAGGSILRWAHNAPIGYMAFPWGWVERAMGADRNGSGLVAFVCVRDDPAVLAAQTAVAGVPAAVPMGAPADTALFAKPVAAALAATGVGSPDAEVAAVRGMITVLTGGYGGAGGVVAAINGGGGMGVGMATLGAALPPADALAAANACIAAHGAGNAPTQVGNDARATNVHGVIGALPARALSKVAYPVDPMHPAPGNGIVRDAHAHATRGALAARQVRPQAPGMPPVGTVLYAEYVAAAFAAWTNILMSDEHARYALMAVLDQLNGAVGVAATAANIAGGGAIHGVAAVGQALTGAQANLVATAAVNVIAVGNAATAAAHNGRAAAAAAVFGIATPHVEAALKNVDLHIEAGTAPFTAGERFVFLNGDAAFGLVRSMGPTAGDPSLPVVVGMTAVHHGAILTDAAGGGGFLDGNRVPWAPGSAAAAAPQVADTAHPQSTAESITRTTNHLVGAPVANLKAEVSHAGAAAAAAIYAVDADFAQAGDAASRATLVSGSCRLLASGVAAVVLDTNLGPAESAEVAIASIAGSVSRYGSGSALEYARAAAAAQVRLRGAAIPFGEVQSLAVEATAATLEANAAAAMGQVGAEVLGPAPAGTAALARVVAADLAVRVGALQVGAYTPAYIARIAVRMVISVLNNPGWNAAAVIAAANALGTAIAGANNLAQLVSPHRAQSTAEAAIAVVTHGAASITAAGNAVAQIAGNLPGGSPPHTSLFAAPIAAAFALSTAGVAAANIAIGALRASIAFSNEVALGLGGYDSLLKRAEIGLIVNGGGGPLGGPANLGIGMANLGAAMTPRQAEALGEAAISVQRTGAALGAAGRRGRGGAAAGALNNTRCRVIEDVVLPIAPALADTKVSMPTLCFAGTPALAVNDANVEAATIAAGAFALNQFTPQVPDNIAAMRPILARLARAARASAAVAGAVDAELNAAHAALGTGLGAGPLGVLRGHVNAVMALSVRAPWGATTLQRVAREAAELAMLSEAGRLSGIPVANIEAAVQAVEGGTVAAATAAAAVAGGPAPGRIAYSYGILIGNGHCHPTSTMGNMGHPHPLALQIYEAHGWTMRRNTPLNANHGGLQSDGAGAHLQGHISLGWDHVNDQNRAVGAVGGGGVGACMVCGPIPANR